MNCKTIGNKFDRHVLNLLLHGGVKFNCKIVQLVNLFPFASFIFILLAFSSVLPTSFSITAISYMTVSANRLALTHPSTSYTCTTRAFVHAAKNEQKMFVFSVLH